MTPFDAVTPWNRILSMVGDIMLVVAVIVAVWVAIKASKEGRHL